MSEKAPGLESYTPTRLEWLVFRLNSLFNTRNLTPDAIEIIFFEGEDGKSVELRVRHYPNVNKERVNTVVNALERFVLQVAKNYGWESWFEFKIGIVEEEREKMIL